MQITFTGHQLDVTTALREFTREKLERVQRHFERITSINITLGIEKVHNVAEATVHTPGASIHAKSESSEDMYIAISGLVDKLDRQLKKYREKETDHH